MKTELELTKLEEEIISVYCPNRQGLCPFPELCDYCNWKHEHNPTTTRLLNFKETVEALTERGQKVSVIPNKKKFHR